MSVNMSMCSAYQKTTPLISTKFTTSISTGVEQMYEKGFLKTHKIHLFLNKKPHKSGFCLKLKTALTVLITFIWLRNSP